MNKSFSGAEGIIQCARIFHGKGELKAVKSSSLLKQTVHLDKMKSMAIIIIFLSFISNYDLHLEGRRGPVV